MSVGGLSSLGAVRLYSVNFVNNKKAKTLAQLTAAHSTGFSLCVVWKPEINGVTCRTENAKEEKRNVLSFHGNSKKTTLANKQKRILAPNDDSSKAVPT